MLFIFLLRLFVTFRPISSGRICKLYAGIDEPLYKHHNSNITTLTHLVGDLLDRVNTIFSDTDTGLFTGQLSETRLRVERLEVMYGWCDSAQAENCTENMSTYLQTFRHYDLTQYCLAYIFTYLDFHNGTGLSTEGGVCTPQHNLGLVSLVNNQQDIPLNQSTLTLARQIAHSFGVKQEDGDEDCGDEDLGSGLSGHSINITGQTNDSISLGQQVSNCSLEDGRRVEEILTDLALDCLVEDDEEPLSVSVCGNGVLEAGEDCDCGQTELTCDDPCCYPALISPQERAANTSARPCSTAARAVCLTPTHVMYGLYIPLLFIFVMMVLITVFLRHDWTRDKSLFKHVTEGNIRIVSRGSRSWHARNVQTGQAAVEEAALNSK